MVWNKCLGEKSGFSAGAGGGDLMAMGEAIGIDLRATGRGTGEIELFIWFIWVFLALETISLAFFFKISGVINDGGNTG